MGHMVCHQVTVRSLSTSHQQELDMKRSFKLKVKVITKVKVV